MSRTFFGLVLGILMSGCSCDDDIQSRVVDASELQVPADGSPEADDGASVRDGNASRADGSMSGDPIDPPTDCVENTPLGALIAELSPGEWKALPNTHMEDVCPMPGYHCRSVMIAWSGGALDSIYNRLIVFGGGHADSPYNNVFMFDLAQMQWHRLTELPWSPPNQRPAYIDDLRVEPCGLYPKAPLEIPPDWLRYPNVTEGCIDKEVGDACVGFTDQNVNGRCVEGGGVRYCNVTYVRRELCDEPALAEQLDPQQPRSPHTYGNLAFSRADGRFYVTGMIGPWVTGQNISRRTFAFDLGTKEWSQSADNPDTDYGRAATDAEGNIWYVRTRGLRRFDPLNNTWDSVIATSIIGPDAVAIDSSRGRLVVIGRRSSLHSIALNEAGTPTTEHVGALPTFATLAPGFEYDDSLDRFVAWAGGRTLHYLDPETWQWSTFEGGGDDPGAAPGQGTYGRFRYSANCGVYVGVSGVGTDVFVFKPPTEAPQPH